MTGGLQDIESPHDQDADSRNHRQNRAPVDCPVQECGEYKRARNPQKEQNRFSVPMSPEVCDGQGQQADSSGGTDAHLDGKWPADARLIAHSKDADAINERGNPHEHAGKPDADKEAITRPEHRREAQRGERAASGEREADQGLVVPLVRLLIELPAELRRVLGGIHQQSSAVQHVRRPLVDGQDQDRNQERQQRALN